MSFWGCGWENLTSKIILVSCTQQRILSGVGVLVTLSFAALYSHY